MHIVCVRVGVTVSVCVCMCVSARAHLPWLQEEVSGFSSINESWSSEKRAEQAHCELGNSHTSGGPRVSVTCH